jgi:hypothetical protein
MMRKDREMDKQTYEAPAVVFEGELEVRAGSPLGVPGGPFEVEDL